MFCHKPKIKTIQNNFLGKRSLTSPGLWAKNGPSPVATKSPTPRDTSQGTQQVGGDLCIHQLVQLFQRSSHQQLRHTLVQGQGKGDAPIRLVFFSKSRSEVVVFSPGKTKKNRLKKNTCSMSSQTRSWGFWSQVAAIDHILLLYWLWF